MTKNEPGGAGPVDDRSCWQVVVFQELRIRKGRDEATDQACNGIIIRQSAPSRVGQPLKLRADLSQIASRHPHDVAGKMTLPIDQIQ